MSRIGRKPLKVPEKVKITLDHQQLKVEGPLGVLLQQIPAGVGLRIEDDMAHVTPPKLNRLNRGYQGLVRALLANMVEGVVRGYECGLIINGVGYKAELKGDKLILSAGYSHLVEREVPKTVKVLVDKTQTKLTVKGINKQLVYQFAAQIRAVKEPEPYKGKGIKYETEVVKRKVGKTGAK